MRKKEKTFYCGSENEKAAKKYIPPLAVVWRTTTKQIEHYANEEEENDLYLRGRIQGKRKGW